MPSSLDIKMAKRKNDSRREESNSSAHESHHRNEDGHSHQHHHRKHDNDLKRSKLDNKAQEHEPDIRQLKQHDKINVKIKQEPMDDCSNVRVKREITDDDENIHHRNRSESCRDQRNHHGRSHDDETGESQLSEQRHGRFQNDRSQLSEQRHERFNNDRRRLERHAAQVKQEPEGGDHPWGGDFRGQGSSSNPDVKKEKEKPTLELSGKLTEDTNTFRGVVIKYVEPEEARKPKKRWRFHLFKGEEALPILHLHRQSAFLLGRDRRVADIPVDHPSCSKQHAVLQFRLVEYRRPDGKMGRRVSPYVIDLGSANGTYVNNQRIEAQRYVELLEKDVVKFGFSSRDYVLLHDGSDTSEVVEDQGDD